MSMFSDLLSNAGRAASAMTEDIFRPGARGARNQDRLRQQRLHTLLGDEVAFRGGEDIETYNKRQADLIKKSGLTSADLANLGTEDVRAGDSLVADLKTKMALDKEKAKIMSAPDLTDKLVAEAAMRQRRTAKLGQGRASQFITGAAGTLAQKSLLGGSW